MIGRHKISQWLKILHAAAIASICFKEKIGVVDGNVYRVLSRYFGISTPTWYFDKQRGELKNRIIGISQISFWLVALLRRTCSWLRPPQKRLSNNLRIIS